MRFKINTITSVACAASLMLASSLSAKEGIYRFRLEKPIPVMNQQGKQIKLVGMQGSSVSFQLAGMGEVSIPIDKDSKIKFTFPYPKDFSDIQMNVLNGNYDKALRLISDPPIDLLRFLAIPEPNCNFHLYTELYYRALAYSKTSQPEEAVAATAAIPWGSANLPPVFMQHASVLLNRLVNEKKIEPAEKLLATLQDGLSIDQFANLALPIADKLRQLGKNEMVESIYDALSKSISPETRKLGRIWTAYNYANTKRIDQAKKLLKEIGEVSQDSPLFPVYCLAQGRLAISQDNTVQALRYLSRAMVQTTIADSYKPEIYFLMIQSYMKDDNSVPASRLAKEMAIFYPQSIWRKSISERYPEIEESNSPKL